MPKDKRTKPASIPNRRDGLITPAEKARQLGVTADTLRRWESEGRIESIRTAGGQRRYREADQPAPTNRSGHSEPSVDELVEETDADLDSPSVELPARLLPRWRQRVEEKKADVEVAKLDREHRAIIREDAAERAERFRRREREQQEAEEERSRETRELRESQRLGALVQEGMTFATNAPLEFQAAAKRDLLTYVSSQRFPGQLTAEEATALLRRRVERLIKPWRDEEHVSDLLKEARTYILVQTLGPDWDFEPAQEARRDIERVLSREVDASWSREDVRARVDELLDEWD